ncbi:MAG: RebB family R body protein [Thermoanaerobaculia bacterium]
MNRGDRYTALREERTLMTVVNPQITDSVTQTNVKVLGDAPAMAMGNLYQTMAHSIGLAMENAAAAQQQINITAQAATVQGIAMLYSLDAAASAEALHKNLQTSAAAVEAAMRSPQPSVKNIAEPADVAYGMRAAADAFAASIHAIGDATCRSLLHVLQIAATSACVTAMIAQPDKAASYEDVLAAIRKIA